jgi:hypothetical protein
MLQIQWPNFFKFCGSMIQIQWRNVSNSVAQYLKIGTENTFSVAG